MDIAAGNAVTANNDDAVDAVVPLSSTKDEDAYVGTLVAFEGVCIGAFTDGAAAANVALLCCCAAATAAALLRKLQFLRYFGTYFGTYICHKQLWQEQELVLISHATRTRISLDISLDQSSKPV